MEVHDDLFDATATAPDPVGLRLLLLACAMQLLHGLTVALRWPPPKFHLQYPSPEEQDLAEAGMRAFAPACLLAGAMCLVWFLVLAFKEYRARSIGFAWPFLMAGYWLWRFGSATQSGAAIARDLYKDQGPNVSYVLNAIEWTLWGAVPFVVYFHLRGKGGARYALAHWVGVSLFAQVVTPLVVRGVLGLF